MSGKGRRRSPFAEKAGSLVGRAGSNPEGLEGHQELRCGPEMARRQSKQNSAPILAAVARKAQCLHHPEKSSTFCFFPN